MKKLIVLTALAFGFAFASTAQENTEKVVKETKTEKKVAKKENPPIEQRQHAEEKSDGHAFSGEGKGGDKNLKDPQKKPKKEKKPKKVKKEKKANM